MLEVVRLAEIRGLHPRRLIGGVRKSLTIPALFAGALCLTVPVFHGLVDRSEAASNLSSGQITVPLLTQSTATGSVGHVRIINHAKRAGTVSIVAYDDTGLRHGPATLAIGAGETVHFDAGDLEEGNAAKGLRRGIGTGTGAWRLELTSALDIEVFSYGRTQDGLVSGMQDVVPQGGSGHRIALFNPASSGGQVSRLRLINPGAGPAAVTVEGIDDAGRAAGGAVRLSLPARASRMVTAEELETGDGEGLSGALGDGDGRWRLLVTADRPIKVMNLLASSSSGAMSNLSSGPVSGVDGDDGATTVHAVGLFPSASNADLEGVLRIVNRTRYGGRVSIEAIDDTGAQRGPATLRIGAQESVVINSGELEVGNAVKGLAASTGVGRGDWRLRLRTSLDIAVLSYVRPLGIQDGLLTAMHDVVPRRAWGHQMTLLAPAETPGQNAHLRLINPSTTEAAVTIRGMDGTGAIPGRAVRLSLAAGASRVVTVPDLEGGTGSGLSGSLGEGEGQWHLAVTANRRIRVMNLLSGPGGHLANLSAAPSGTDGALASLPGGPADTATAAEVFSQHISGPVVQSRCVACHVEGGVSGNTRLVFERSTTPDHEALNLAAFSRLLSEVEGGTPYVLNKIQGVSHGGGAPVPAGSTDFAQMQRFLGMLDTDVVPAAITVETLFDTVRMAPLRKTLRRAALIFAGRIPTDAEYASIYTGPTALRRTIRNMMTGPGFHDFLIRGANDRLLTNRMGRVVDPPRGYFVDFTNEHYARSSIAYRTNNKPPLWHWLEKTQHGFRRAPVELIAHVVENDRPYTEILTADYIMANPFAARAYGASTVFSDPEDPHEFKPSRIAKYYRQGEEFEREDDRAIGASRVLNPGPLSTVYPHSGILNTTSFLFRYPTTATNRNRARARWTYYHFLGVDIEKSAPRTMDPVALADTNNPTMHNPACTVCHTVMDPVAGAFQDYGDEGLYKDQWGGMDSLHRLYKEDDGTPLNVEATSWQDRETLTWPFMLSEGTAKLRVRFTNPFYDEVAREGSTVYLDRLNVLDDQGRRVKSVEFEDVDVPVPPRGSCGRPRRNTGSGSGDYLAVWGGWKECALYIEVAAATAGVYTAEVIVWSDGYDERYGDDGYAQLAVTANGYVKGDTWYRDMRTPGFGGELAPQSVDSLQWLARKIVADPRFAEATVKFWWPAIMGSEVAEPPAEEGDADFEGQLLAANAQSAEVRRLAEGFRNGFTGRPPYNLKDLLVEIVLSKWFRADALSFEDPVRAVALRDAGARRLLTPEELANKTAALTGYQWGRYINVRCSRECDREPNSLTRRFRLLYGGIDSDGITERARSVTSVMAGVAKRHAVQTSCPVVMRDFYLVPEEDRRLFRGIDQSTRPDLNFGALFEIEAEARTRRETLSLEGSLPEGLSTVRLSFTNEYRSPETSSAIHLDRLDVRDAAGRVVASYELETVEPKGNCKGPDRNNNFALWCESSLDVPISVPAKGQYKIEIVAWADHAGDELPQLDAVVLNATNAGAGAKEIRAKLVELYDTLLGVEVTPYSPDVNAAFELLVDVMERQQSTENVSSNFNPWHCRFWKDKYFFEGILNDILQEYENEWGAYIDFDEGRRNAYINSIDFSDSHFTARAWVVVLSYFLMDYRYLYL